MLIFWRRWILSRIMIHILRLFYKNYQLLKSKCYHSISATQLILFSRCISSKEVGAHLVNALTFATVVKTDGA